MPVLQLICARLSARQRAPQPQWMGTVTLRMASSSVGRAQGTLQWDAGSSDRAVTQGEGKSSDLHHYQ